MIGYTKIICKNLAKAFKENNQLHVVKQVTSAKLQHNSRLFLLNLVRAACELKMHTYKYTAINFSSLDYLSFRCIPLQSNSHLQIIFLNQ